jgi:hypothetical protein
MGDWATIRKRGSCGRRRRFLKAQEWAAVSPQDRPLLSRVHKAHFVSGLMPWPRHEAELTDISLIWKQAWPDVRHRDPWPCVPECSPKFAGPGPMSQRGMLEAP